jgi:hypothetical protein
MIFGSIFEYIFVLFIKEDEDLRMEIERRC